MPQIFRSAHFEIRPAERLLLVKGRPAEIGPRAFDVLIALVERRDRLVTKDELLDVVWPGRCVEEGNLAVHVSALRKALEAPRAIATIPGRGYRFVAALEDSPQLPAAHPPMNSPPVAALVGRADDLAQLNERLSSGACVTVVGAGGIGKTALARAVAQARASLMRDGAVWVDLTEVPEETRLAGTILQALEQRWRLEGASAARGVDLQDQAHSWPALLQALQPLALLLVLDNAEHLLAPVSRLVRRMRAAAPGVALLVTSQAPLRVEGEQVFRLGPLAVPGDGAGPEEALRYGAVALFVQCARAADRRFALDASNADAVVRLCRSLDGSPLALKLAAARVPMLGLDGLVRRLDDRLRVLGPADRGAPARQQTLESALDWSHALLAEPLQVVFRRLAIFSGGFPIEMMAAVAGDGLSDETAAIDALSELVDRSMVDVEGTSWMRYRLPETVRAYARHRLERAGELDQVQRRHAEAVADALDAGYERYWSSADGPWLERYAPELPNVRVALDWAQQTEPSLGMRLIGSTAVLFMLLGQAPEARKRFAALEAFAGVGDGEPATARYWLERSRLQWGLDSESMLTFALRAAELHRRYGDRRGLALSLRCAISSERMRPEEAASALAEMTALERPDAPPRLKAQRLLAEAHLRRAGGRIAEACAVAEALVELTIRAGLDGMAAAALAVLASSRLAAGDAHAALEGARRLLADPRARRGKFLLHPLGTTAQAYLMLGDVTRAREALEEFAAASRVRGWEWFGAYAGAFALLAASEGRVGDATRLLGYADRVAHRLDSGASESDAARSLARAAIGDRIEEEALRCQLAEGAGLDEETACAIALVEPTPSRSTN